MSEYTTIQIEVLPEAAQVYGLASESERKKMAALVSLRLLAFGHEQESLETVMREISRTAQERGLTPDLLEDLLRE